MMKAHRLAVFILSFIVFAVSAQTARAASCAITTDTTAINAIGQLNYTIQYSATSQSDYQSIFASNVSNVTVTYPTTGANSSFMVATSNCPAFSDPANNPFCTIDRTLDISTLNVNRTQPATLAIRVTSGPNGPILCSRNVSIPATQQNPSGTCNVNSDCATNWCVATEPTETGVMQRMCCPLGYRARLTGETWTCALPSTCPTGLSCGLLTPAGLTGSGIRCSDEDTQTVLLCCPQGQTIGANGQCTNVPNTPPNTATDETEVGVVSSELTQQTLNNINPLLLFGNQSETGDLSTPGGFLSRVLFFAFPLAGLLLFVMLVWGGFEVLSGATYKKNLDAGKNRITAAIIGFLLLFASYWIAQIIGLIFGARIF